MMTTKLLLLAAALLLAVTPNNHAQPRFSKIPIDAGNAIGGVAWVDIDNDAYLDVVVANGVATSGGSNAVFRNNGKGGFSRITSGSIATDLGYSLSIACGDYDNDGLLDLFFGGAFGPGPTVPGLFYRNAGAGNFQGITDSPLVTTLGNFTATWVDYDNDGFLDIFFTNTGGSNRLFRNQGDGSFTTVPSAIPAHSAGGNLANGSAWADYDNDGFADVFIFGGTGRNLLLHNDGSGKFTRVRGAPFDTDLGPSAAAAWADYDNDGFLDLFVTNGQFDTIPRPNYLYRNNGDGSFSKITTGAIATDLASSVIAAWEDFNNDGHLDVIVAQNSGSGPALNNLLYQNNGDGTFTSLTNTALTSDAGYFAGVAWGDYDNNGTPDLVVAAGQPRFIYHGEGNTNRWLTLRLVGAVSNRSAIGAKVRVRSRIQGKSQWQMRYISNGNGLAGNSLDAHFGLGDAAAAEILRIEWPSGIVQELQNVPANQILSVTEPSRLSIAGAGGAAVQITLKGGRNFRYDIETGTDLTHWSLLNTVTVTNLDGRALVAPVATPGSDHRFYRAVLR